MLSKGPIGNEEFITFDLTLDTKPTDIPILSKVVSILFLDYVSELKKNLSIFVLGFVGYGRTVWQWDMCT